MEMEERGKQRELGKKVGEIGEKVGLVSLE